MNPELEQIVREHLGSNEIPAPMMAELSSILAYCEMAYKAIERAREVSAITDWTPSAETLSQAGTLVLSVGEACRTVLLTLARVGVERESQKEMES